ncbi:MAG TPA: OmpH family outer membrane protein [Bacteroidales bacterium]|nr:OmpH family outer membrane protein [Bacteroidales bacterium]
MKHINSIVNIVLAVGLIVLYILHFTGNGNGRPATRVAGSDSTSLSGQLPIAYINVDSLLLNYNYSKDLNEVLIRKRENAQATLTEKARKLDGEMKEFQRKRENNAFLSEQSFKSQQQALMKKQQDLQQLEETLTQQLGKEQQKMNEQLRDSIYKFLQEYNKDHKFQMILSNTMNDNIMVADNAYNITNEVVELLNSKYVKAEE